MKTYLSTSLSILAMILMFVSSANAISLTADPGTVGSPPSNISIPLLQGSTGSDLNTFYIDFVGSEFIELTGPSQIEIILETTWNIPVLGQTVDHIFAGRFGFYDINGNFLGLSFSSSFDYNPFINYPYSFSISSVSSPFIFPPIYSLRWTPFYDIPTLVDFLGPNTNTLASGTLTLNMERVNGVVGETVAPVPEPSTLLLFGAGLAGVGLMRRRFKK